MYREFCRILLYLSNTCTVYIVHVLDTLKKSVYLFLVYFLTPDFHIFYLFGKKVVGRK